ncbi:MAG: MgtC/SapB transporter [Planctomycetota bacterium]|nr:MgtC/SapB transporter [Planctomycetota bacterium]
MIDAQPIVDFGTPLVRLGAAALIGGAVGLNREFHDKPAGLRTHAMVCLGAALASYLSIEVTASGQIADMSAFTRVIQGILTGIGFLGAGVIFREESGKHVQGLTTAATIWVVACLGVGCGAGRWHSVSVAVGLAFVVLVLGGPVERTAERLRKKYGLGQPPATPEGRPDDAAAP